MRKHEATDDINYNIPPALVKKRHHRGIGHRFDESSLGYINQVVREKEALNLVGSCRESSLEVHRF